jgi:hypothetical protein
MAGWLLVQDRGPRYRDLIAIETVHTLNAAFCDYHTTHCPASPQLSETCGRARDAYAATKAALAEVEANWDCADHYVGAGGARSTTLTTLTTLTALTTLWVASRLSPVTGFVGAGCGHP